MCEVEELLLEEKTITIILNIFVKYVKIISILIIQILLTFE